MAFESHVLENGRWISRTTNILDLINKAAARPAAERQHAPKCGIMSRTLVHSPVAHWILSVRLRSSQHNDVAFIGDHYVQIAELRRDGQLHRVARKCDFGSRIRNARIIGTSPVKLGFEQYATTTYNNSNNSKSDDDADLDMMDMIDSTSPNSSQHGSSSHHHLPPQLLLIVLETGDSIFLFLQPDKDGDFKFVALQYNQPSARLIRPGFHLAVDPSSRYAAQACCRNMFVVHHLESMDNLSSNLARGQPLRPVLSSRPRFVNGVIHTIEFLYPRPEDPQHIILLLIVISDARTRMYTFDWILGDDLTQVLAEEKVGCVLPPEHDMPLMIIPLTVRSAFIVVSEDSIAWCADVLHGPPSFEPFRPANPPPTENHEGVEPPLWTAWSRPPRLFPYNQTRDFIYMAREDGAVIVVECDFENVLGSSFHHGNFCNVSTAFCSLADDASSAEVLVIGGDSGQGGVWSAVPRGPVTKLCQIPHWSPSVDFVTTNESSRWDNLDGATGKTSKEYSRLQDGRTPTSDIKTDKIYVAAGTGLNGSIVEYRHGLQASIGIEFDFGTFIRRCFMLSENELDPSSGYHLFLTVADRTVLLYFDADFSTASARDIDQDQTPFVLSSPTLLAQAIGQGVILQVTEECLFYVISPTNYRYISFHDLGLGDLVVTDAAILGNVLVITSHVDNDFHLDYINLDTKDYQATHGHSEVINQGEVTALTLYEMAGKVYAVACLNLGNSRIVIERYCVTDRTHDETISLGDIPGSTDMCEAITSIVCIVTQDTQETVVVAGTRDGFVITINLSRSDVKVAERIGSMPAYVYSARRPDSVFICCGNGFYLATDYRNGRGIQGRGLNQKQSIWTVDADDSSKPSPAITSVTALQKSLSGNESNVPLLLLANDHFYLAELQPHAGPVQRHLPLGMTPFKVLFSHVLKCLVVAARTPDNRTTLRFIDPASGEDLSFPLNGQTKEPVEYINGLGNTGDRILCLEEWHITNERGHSYYYLLAGTRGVGKDPGRLIIASCKRERPAPGESKGKIKFWTRHKVKPPAEVQHGPVWSVSTSGHYITASIGPAIYQYKLCETDRKFAIARFLTLDAPVWRISVQPDSSRMVALVKGEGVQALMTPEDDADPLFTVTHVEPATRSGMDMLEVAGAWDPFEFTPTVSSDSKSNSIVLVSDQDCSLAGLWIPWDTPGRDCEILFEADLPSSVRRLRLGRTLPAWSRERRSHRKYGLLPAALHQDAQILGMGIDGSMQHFTILDLDIWTFLRFVQNVAETSAELYPFTHIDLHEEDDHFDPVPDLDHHRMEMQVDGDLMQRCLEKRALEGLMGRREEWMERFRQYLENVDGGRWRLLFARDDDDTDDSDEEELNRTYFAVAYDILEYLLVPII